MMIHPGQTVSPLLIANVFRICYNYVIAINFNIFMFRGGGDPLKDRHSPAVFFKDAGSFFRGGASAKDWMLSVFLHLS